MFGLNDSFDDFFNVPSFTRSRRALPGSNPRTTRSAGDSLIPSNGFDDFFNEPMMFKENFYNPRDEVKLKEEDDKYIVYFDDERINQKELKVDYLKKQNQLRLSIFEKSGDGEESQITSSYQSSLGFDKPVKYDEIKADIGDSKVSITIPKVESDEENIVNIQLTGNNVKPLVDSHPIDSKSQNKIE